MTPGATPASDLREIAQVLQAALDASQPQAHEIALPKAWAGTLVLDLLVIAQALERAPQRAPFPAVPVLLSGALAFWAGLTVGWILWGL